MTVAGIDPKKGHTKVPCAQCKKCCCPKCKARSAEGKWFAPPSGGYHGCVPSGYTPPPPPKVRAK